ncbi:MAG: hypothetical protein QM791_07180 [Ferruginibacter sp.]
MNTEYTISTEEFESIEQYLLGNLPQQEKLAFDNRLQQDIEWAAKVKEVSLLTVGIEAAVLKEKLNTYHAKLPNNTQEKKGGRIISFNFKMLLAASVVLFAAVGVWLFFARGNSYERMYADYYKPDPGLVTAMGTTDNYLFNKAMVDYKTGNYKKAIGAWSELKAGLPPNDTLNYFLGAAQQADGNSTAALTLLKQAAADTANPFYKDACWYTGLALLKEGHVQEAVPYLEKSGHAGNTELINKLK